MDDDPTQSAQSIKSQLLEEWPDLFIEVEDGPMVVIKIYGARESEKQAKKRAEGLRDQRKLEDQVEVRSVGWALCSKSEPVKATRNRDEPVQSIESPVSEEDGRGVLQRCNNADGHVGHDWGTYYRPLLK